MHLPYAESPLHTLDLCLPRPLADSPPDAIWVIYVHGGAWRDPDTTSASLDPALALLRDSPQLAHVAGFASINYRLSPYPTHPTNPSAPDDPSRNVQHPAHVQDVATALRWLAREHGVGRTRDWACVGHSCGATLAFQLLKPGCIAGGDGTPEERRMSLPVAVVGLEGLYDLGALAERHADQSAYAEFLAAAFGPDQRVWRNESPSAEWCHPRLWPGRRVVVLGHSPEDELVETEQTTEFADRLRKSEIELSEDGGARRLQLLKLEGKHDEVWSKGKGLAYAIEAMIKSVFH